MLEAAIALQIGLGEFIEAALIGGLLLCNATLGFIQEGRAGAALAALKKRLASTALVRRDGEWIRLPATELVPGAADAWNDGTPVEFLCEAAADLRCAGT
jgi:H+-transporting ATPase